MAAAVAAEWRGLERRARSHRRVGAGLLHSAQKSHTVWYPTRHGLPHAMSSRTPCHAMLRGIACCVARYPARRSIRAARAMVQVLPVLWRPPAPRTLPESGTLIRAWPILPLRSIPMIPLRCTPTRPIPHSRTFPHAHNRATELEAVAVGEGREDKAPQHQPRLRQSRQVQHSNMLRQCKMAQHRATCCNSVKSGCTIEPG